MNRFIAFILLAATSVSCNAAIKTQVRVSYYGDSTAYGSTLGTDGTYHRSRDNEGDYLQWLLQSSFGNFIYVENHAVPGSVCNDFINATRGVVNTWSVEMANSPADIVIMNVGLNDASHISDNDFINCYTTMAKVAKANGKIFVIETPNPMTGTINQSVWALVHDEQYVADHCDLWIIDQWNNTMNTVPNWQSMLPDGIHPNDAYYRIKAQYAVQALSPLIQAVYDGQ